MLHRIEELARLRSDLAFETTLAGRAIRRRIIGLMDAGYDLHLFYLWLPSPELAVARVRRRVASGGHDVPEGVIRRRFWRSLVNFDQICRHLPIAWRLYDGSAIGGRPLIARVARGGNPVVDDEERWSLIQKQIAEHTS